jgi:hypothetical protein
LKPTIPWGPDEANVTQVSPIEEAMLRQMNERRLLRVDSGHESPDLAHAKDC